MDEKKELDGLVKLGRSYAFEGRSYDEVDLSGLDGLTARDMMEAEKYLFKTGVVSALPDQTVGYVCFIAARVSGLPVEFFLGLAPRDMNRVKNRVAGFFYGGD